MIRFFNDHGDQVIPMLALAAIIFWAFTAGSGKNKGDEQPFPRPDDEHSRKDRR
jgi:hypothetical protein